jgi:transcriptional regulator of acetoin/glycerol metabolism
LAWLCEGDYEGNVRQLEGVIEHAYLLARTAGREAIVPADISDRISPPLLYPRKGPSAEKIKAMCRALERTGGNIAGAARLLGVSRNTIKHSFVSRITGVTSHSTYPSNPVTPP